MIATSSGYRHGDTFQKYWTRPSAGVQAPRHEPHILTDLDLLAGRHLPVEATAVVERDHRHLQRVRSRIDVVTRAREHASAARQRPALTFDAGGRRVRTRPSRTTPSSRRS